MEQGHRRAQLHRVDRAEDVLRRSPRRFEDRPRALEEPRPDDRMGEVGTRLGERPDGVAARHLAATQARELGQDEPHPVARLAPQPKFGERSRVGRKLSGNEPLEIVVHRQEGTTIDIAGAIPIASTDGFDAWLTAHAVDTSLVIVAIHKQTSPHHTIGLIDLQEVALCHGWVDTLTQRIDDERYAIRFVPRRAHSNWGASNRDMARRLLAEGRITEAGRAVLPDDL